MRADGPHPLVAVVGVVLPAVAGVALVYGSRIDTGLFYDDFFLVRPWTAAELRRVFYGSWDPTGVSVLFFRPATSWLYAARFEVFGVNTAAMHMVSLAGHGLCAVLAAWFLRREGASRVLASFAAWLYAIHPALPYGHASWLTNQMHLAQSMVVLSALLVWQTVRECRPLCWTPLAALAAVAFLIKEDGIMLLPTLGALTAIRAWIQGQRLPEGWRSLAIGGVAAVGALIAFRFSRIGQLGGYGAPSVEQATTNWWRGVRTVLLLWPTARVWQGVAAGVAMGLVAGALAAGVKPWRERRLVLAAGALVLGTLALQIPPALGPMTAEISPFAWPPLAGAVATAALVIGLACALLRPDRRALWFLSAGVAMLLSFNLPFFLVSKREQYHLLALGSVVALAGCAQGIAGSRSTSGARPVLAGFLVAASLPLGFVARERAGDFRPCAPSVLHEDVSGRGWWMVPEALRGWIDARVEGCRSGREPPRMVDLPLVMWGVHEERRLASGEAVHVTADRVVMLTPLHTRVVALAVRREDAEQDRRVRVAIRHGRRTHDLTLDSSEWHYATISLTPTLLARTRRSHRVDVEVLDWFVPAVRDPLSTDLRRFGVELRVITPAPGVTNGLSRRRLTEQDRDEGSSGST